MYHKTKSSTVLYFTLEIYFEICERGLTVFIRVIFIILVSIVIIGLNYITSTLW